MRWSGMTAQVFSVTSPVEKLKKEVDEQAIEQFSNDC